MALDKKKAVLAGVTGGALELAKVVPGLGALIESVRGYQENIENQQREAFVEVLSIRMDEMRDNAEWYKSPDGEEFVKKVVATALNAEYTDKIEYLANVLVNGPQLANDNARRQKFVEMVRQLSKPALDVLVASLKHRSGTGQVIAGDLARILGWHPSMVDACVQELYAVGAFSNVTAWYTQGEIHPMTSFQAGTAAVTDITQGLARFISC
jgi:hypothetical protein